MNRLLLAQSRRGAKKGTPHYWEKTTMEHGWPQYQRFYEHSRQPGQHRQIYKDRTYVKQNYAMGPRELEIILINNENLQLGSAGEILNVDLKKARQLVEDQDAVHNKNNQAIYGFLHGLDISTDDSEVSVADRRLKSYLITASQLSGEGLTLDLSKAKPTTVITKQHFARALQKIDVTVEDEDCIRKLFIRDEVHRDFEFLPKFLARYNLLSDNMRLEVMVGQ